MLQLKRSWTFSLQMGNTKVMRMCWLSVHGMFSALNKVHNSWGIRGFIGEDPQKNLSFDSVYSFWIFISFVSVENWCCHGFCFCSFKLISSKWNNPKNGLSLYYIIFPFLTHFIIYQGKQNLNHCVSFL